MTVEEISRQQQQPTASLDDQNPPNSPAGLRPIEAALWEIALQIALANEKLEVLCGR